VTAISQGVRLGLDYGTVRVGWARSDSSGLIASPGGAIENQEATFFDQIAEIIADYSPCAIYIGKPTNLKGEDAKMSETVQKWAGQLAKRFDETPMRMVDERLSSSIAQSQLRAAGRRPSREKGTIDAQAAAVLLQSALDFERLHGRFAGDLVIAPNP
jgi:putative Holliday junction resolvase